MNPTLVALKKALRFIPEISDDAIEKLSRYADLLVEWNEKMNLTAIVDPEEMAYLHYLDSLSILPEVRQAFKNKDLDFSWSDIGTGAGFPSLPIQMVEPMGNLTCVDSLKKRLGFLETVIAACEVKQVSCVHGRAEDLGQSLDYRESFDLVTARAVAPLPVLLEYCLPFVKKDGVLIAMKSVQEDYTLAQAACERLGGVFESIRDFSLADREEQRRVIVIRKLAKTPKLYPRKPGLAKKDPL